MDVASDWMWSGKMFTAGYPTLGTDESNTLSSMNIIQLSECNSLKHCKYIVTYFFNTIIAIIAYVLFNIVIYPHNIFSMIFNTLKPFNIPLSIRAMSLPLIFLEMFF